MSSAQKLFNPPAFISSLSRRCFLSRERAPLCELPGDKCSKISTVSSTDARKETAKLHRISTQSRKYAEPNAHGGDGGSHHDETRVSRVMYYIQKRLARAR